MNRERLLKIMKGIFTRLNDFNRKHNYKLSIVDFLDCIKFIFLFPISKIFFRYLKKQKIWIVAENPNEACDNGYIFYKYLKKEHPEINSYYIIKKGVKDYEKVIKLGNVIFYRSLKHWIYYLNADKIFVTQKYANPSQALFYILHNMNIIKNNRIFLQHGVTKEDLIYFHYRKTKFNKFICGAKREYEFILKKFGYPYNSVVYTGFARFDNLSLEPNNSSEMILIMPTWRKWIFNVKEDYKYFEVYNNLVNNKKLINYLRQNGYQINFVLHKNMKLYKERIKSNNNVIKIYNNEEIDIQELLNKCRMLVTDYSSIAMDAAYRQIPVIYYQFDLKKFEKEHHKLEGSYFSYEKDGFGEIITNEEELVNKMIDYCGKDFKIEEKYLNRMKVFFERRDKKNCERIYLSCKD